MVDLLRDPTPTIDSDGRAIQAHGGGLLVDDGIYYWFGENKDADTEPSPVCEFRTPVTGITCYSSEDLQTWSNRGLAFDISDATEHSEISVGGVLERPKVVRNSRGQYVMWFHVDDAQYSYARVGVAVAERATGPFSYRGSVRPDGHESRDFTVFIDDDGQGYLIFSSEGNANLRLVRLSHDLTEVAGPSTVIVHDQYREAPAIWKRDGTYFMITSGCTGWDPNAAQLATAQHVEGPWVSKQGSPLRGADADVSFGSQSAYVASVLTAGSVRQLFMADKWVPSDLRSSSYLWRWVDYEDGVPVIHG